MKFGLRSKFGFDFGLNFCLNGKFIVRLWFKNKLTTEIKVKFVLRPKFGVNFGLWSKTESQHHFIFVLIKGMTD